MVMSGGGIGGGGGGVGGGGVGSCGVDVGVVVVAGMVLVFFFMGLVRVLVPILGLADMFL